MADLIRIKRRTAPNQPGAPSGLANAELAYNEVDHILYYGEGTGGSTSGLPAGVPGASIVTAVGGLGLFSNANPNMDNIVATPGTATTYTRADHIHPTDTSRAPTASPTFTGTVTISGSITGAGMNSWAGSPPSIGNVQPSTGHFTNLVVDGTITGSGVSGLLGAYLPLAGVTPMTGPLSVGSAGAWQTLASGAASFTGGVTLNQNNVLQIGINNHFVISPTAPGSTPTFRMLGGDANVGLNFTASGTGIFAFTTPVTGPTPVMTDSSPLLATTAFVKGQRLDQFQPPTAPVSWNNQYIQNLLDPLNNQDAATKKYVDGAAQGLKSKAAVQAATTGANIALTGLQIIDGYTTVAGDRILVKDQTAAANNGLYVASATGWNRTTDMDAWAEVPNAYVFVSQGTVNQNSSWTCTSPLTGGTIGVDAITWVQFSQSATITAGNGLNKVGNTLNVIGTANRIAVGAAVDIASDYAGQGSIVWLGSVAIGTWTASTIGVSWGGTGATTLTGYLKGNGVNPFAAVAQIPNSDIAGLGTMAVQNANAVAITGGTIDGVVFDCGTF